MTEAIARIPFDHFVIWDGSRCAAQAGSLRSRALGLVEEPWTPIQLRTLVQRAARLCEGAGLDPDTVREAVRMHQSARAAAYYLVRKTLAGEYLAVTDIPWPVGARGPIRAGSAIMDRQGRIMVETRPATHLEARSLARA
ncbi:hypothetical protein [Phenylobacterium soli]|uniref:Uncharacterized protein n=1 Tax=Phenylobacterium soli TaxID=2170551 RepID=A0A328APQ1_9CAUL|nr:hypothetical protein [Phenylobacterium soli]RAK54828.1 hypothetical protein DJ017_09975 [Phenylobacterium soli]